MNGRRKTVFKWVTGTHAGVLLLLLLVPWLKGCFHRPPKIIATFDLSAPPPPPPEIVPEVPQPKPEPKPEKKIAPPSTNTPPKKVATKKPKPAEKKPATPEKKPETKKAETKPAAKPKTLEERLAEVRKGGKQIKPAPAAKPALDLSGLKSALNSSASGSSYGTGNGSGSGAYSPFAWYYAQVQQKMYQAWLQPSSAPKGLTAEATIRVETDGRVSSKSITRRSGNFAFDQSVQNALNDTTALPPPPAGLPSRMIEIEFALTD